jgi:hypothetical protein
MSNVIKFPSPKYSPRDIRMFMAEVHRFLETLDTLEAIRELEQLKAKEKPQRFDPNF